MTVKQMREFLALFDEDATVLVTLDEEFHDLEYVQYEVIERNHVVFKFTDADA